MKWYIYYGILSISFFAFTGWAIHASSLCFAISALLFVLLLWYGVILFKKRKQYPIPPGSYYFTFAPAFMIYGLVKSCDNLSVWKLIAFAISFILYCYLGYMYIKRTRHKNEDTTL